MIDLHTHTTASDGRCTPAELVSRARAAGISVLAVTDHDTMAGCAAAADACAAPGETVVTFVPGIEITAIAEGVDVHVLGYFVERRPRFVTFLQEQRRIRLSRVREIVERLKRHGITLDADAILRPALADSTLAAGRPWIARALIAGGHVADSNEAFDRWLQRGRPAFVERAGPSPARVFTEIHAAGGVASLAHPGLLKRDEWIPGFAAAGLDAVEAFHTEHPPDATSRYLAMARALQLEVSGGSDYHADESRAARLGGIALPQERFEGLKSRLASIRSSDTGDVGPS